MFKRRCAVAASGSKVWLDRPHPSLLFGWLRRKSPHRVRSEHDKKDNSDDREKNNGNNLQRIVWRRGGDAQESRKRLPVSGTFILGEVIVSELPSVQILPRDVE